MTQSMHERRMAELERVGTHAWLGRIWQRLGEDQRIMVGAILAQHAELDVTDFDRMVQRLWLDQEKPRGWKEMGEILSCVNSGAHLAIRGTPENPR